VFLSRPRWISLAGLAFLLSLNAGCSPVNPPKTVLLCGFENLPEPGMSGQPLDPPVSLKKPAYEGDDYGWATGGYVELQPWPKFATQGKYSARARFTVPSDFKSLSQTARLTSWEAGMTLTRDTATKLSTTDWSPYAILAVDFYNPDPKEYQAFLRVTDSHSNVTETAGLVKASGKSTVAMALTQVAEARLDPHDIKILEIYLDTLKEASDPVLYLDNVRLDSSTKLKLK
jgi:hypothetical protein